MGTPLSHYSLRVSYEHMVFSRCHSCAGWLAVWLISNFMRTVPHMPQEVQYPPNRVIIVPQGVRPTTSTPYPMTQRIEICVVLVWLQ